MEVHSGILPLSLIFFFSFHSVVRVPSGLLHTYLLDCSVRASDQWDNFRWTNIEHLRMGIESAHTHTHKLYGHTQAIHAIYSLYECHMYRIMYNARCSHSEKSQQSMCAFDQSNDCFGCAVLVLQTSVSYTFIWFSFISEMNYSIELQLYRTTVYHCVLHAKMECVENLLRSRLQLRQATGTGHRDIYMHTACL